MPALKKLVSILLLTVVLTQAFSRFLMVLDYQVNKDYIAAFLCVNKDQPKRHCEGHCYLQKNLKKADDAEKNTINQHQKIEITLFYQALFRIEPIVYRNVINYPVHPDISYFFLAAQNTFHPPQITI